MPLDLSLIDSMTTARRRTLEASGIRTVDDLARIEVAAVAGRTGIPPAPLRDFKRKASALVLAEALQDLGRTMRSIGPGAVAVLADVAVEGLRQAVADAVRRAMPRPQAGRAQPDDAQPASAAAVPKSQASRGSRPIVSFTARPTGQAAAPLDQASPPLQTA